MKKQEIAFLLVLGTVVGACAEQKTRIWIEPPVGYESQRGTRNLVYKVEDPGTGKKESLLIPLTQVPQNLVVEDRTVSQPEEQATVATKADKALHEGKLSIAPDAGKAPPSVSYLSGLEQIQDLYQEKKYSKALIQIAPLIEQYPKQVRLFTMQGTLYKKVGEKKMALLAFRKAHELDPGNAPVEEALRDLEGELGEQP